MRKRWTKKPGFGGVVASKCIIRRRQPSVRPSDRAAGSEGATRRQLWRSGMRAILAGSLSVQPTRGEGPNATTISRHECLRLSSAVITQGLFQ